jgi:MFS family permease
MLLDLALYGGLVPGAAAAALLWLACRAAWPDRAAAGHWGAAAALATGFVVGYALTDVPSWRPSASWHWPPYLAVAAACLVFLEVISRLPTVVRAAMEMAFTGVAAWLSAPELRETATFIWLLRAALAIAMLLTWWSLAAWARRQPGVGFFALLTVIALVGAVVVTLAGSLRLGQPVGFLAAGIAGIGLGAWWLNERTPSQGVAPVLAILLAGMMCNGYFHRGYDDFPMASFILVGVAPMALALTGLAVQRLPSQIGRAGLLLVSALAPTGIALLMAIQAGGSE